ncbi:MAG TPA: hypothetical protein VHK47_10035 [Polyangia bacterium]|jgi:hypothetical protein|nr:hypothetical protein [Polyangia bacterium]
MLGLYKDVAITAARRAARSWLAAVSIPIYALAVLGTFRLTAPLGMIGGFIVGLVAAACFGAYLSLLAAALDGTKLRFSDLRNGLGAIWDVISVFFALWVVDLVVGVLKGAAGPKADAVAGVASLAIAIFFNVVPELIYQSHNRSFAALKASVDFVTQNPFAWFPPNLVFAFVLLWATGTLSFSSPGALLVTLSRLGSASGALTFIGAAPLWMAPLLIVFVHYVMVFRGLLFRELTRGGGNQRMRAFRQSMGR